MGGVDYAVPCAYEENTYPNRLYFSPAQQFFWAGGKDAAYLLLVSDTIPHVKIWICKSGR
jgi:hypothetical protein